MHLKNKIDMELQKYFTSLYTSLLETSKILCAGQGQMVEFSF